MASLTDTLTGLKNKPEASGSTQQRYPVQYINYACLEASAYNFYPMSEIEDLSDAVEACRRHSTTPSGAQKGTGTL